MNGTLSLPSCGRKSHIYPRPGSTLQFSNNKVLGKEATSLRMLVIRERPLWGGVTARSQSSRNQALCRRNLRRGERSPGAGLPGAGLRESSLDPPIRLGFLTHSL